MGTVVNCPVSVHHNPSFLQFSASHFFELHRELYKRLYSSQYQNSVLSSFIIVQMRPCFPSFKLLIFYSKHSFLGKQRHLLRLMDCETSILELIVSFNLAL